MNAVKRFAGSLLERYFRPEMPSPVEEKTKTLVKLLMRDYSTKEQNEIMSQTLKLLIEKRLELAEVKKTELQELISDNVALCSLNV